MTKKVLTIRKDKIIGLIVMLLGAIIGILYVLGSLVDYLIWEIAENPAGLDLTTSWLGIDIFKWQFFVVAPMCIIVVLIAVVAVWIGYSMLTTPAPVPLEELEQELAAEEKVLNDKED
ncbi:MAG: hypothetical protein KGD63_00675 [Candidatus Lokiarchaeota archaeon]|nr:hypothetical protein [Candidatus Lokiarchaeota archaeon]